MSTWRPIVQDIWNYFATYSLPLRVSPALITAQLGSQGLRGCFNHSHIHVRRLWPTIAAEIRC